MSSHMTTSSVITVYHRAHHGSNTDKEILELLM